jgi:hypothetical protein
MGNELVAIITYDCSHLQHVRCLFSDRLTPPFFGRLGGHHKWIFSPDKGIFSPDKGIFNVDKGLFDPFLERIDPHLGRIEPI